jgi:broad specificity phosphatase PhoE
LFGATTVLAQRKTIILVRHAEKDTSATADQNDPVLTPQGIERTRRLAEKIGRYRPGAVYSTDYKRTRDTASPIAQKRRKEIQIYDARKPQELIERIMQSTTKRFVIVGHSNTIPPLANLIMKKEVFKNLDDPEHSVIWLIRIKNGKAIKVELLDY